MTWIFLTRARARPSTPHPFLQSFTSSSHHSPLFDHQSNNYKLDIVDHQTWQLSTGFAHATTNPSLVTTNASNNPHDLDDIDDLRIYGNLFYKLDRDSKEYDEYNFNFHTRKGKSYSPSTPNENVPKPKDQIKIKQNPTRNNLKTEECEKKKERVPTFNQITAAYHEPFCLDIYISKASVRACIVHRATSNVVVVAHSISKDMKFDFGCSTRNVNVGACVAVGKVLAQRALADDIHNVVYTPRKGDKLEGKLQTLLYSLTNNGVSVKLKIKHKKLGKSGFRT